jgi:outer membrane protein OmpA-like peptidoglycan-associated protein
MKNLSMLLATILVAGCAGMRAAQAPARWGFLDNCPYGENATPRECGVEEEEAPPQAVAVAPAPAPVEPAPIAVAPVEPPAPPPPVVQPEPIPEAAPPAPAPRVVVTENKFELKDVVYFDTAKATIQPRSHSLLDEVATAIKQHPEVKRLVIEGHTDSRGDRTFNTKLSQERAEAVSRYLVERGIERERLAAKGYGPTRPVSDNKTAKGREANRRVELMVDRSF